MFFELKKGSKFLKKLWDWWKWRGLLHQKWRNLSESDRDAYKKVATDSESAVSLPSADKQAKKIIGNIMKQVSY